MGQPCPALACSSSANEGFGYDLSGHGRGSEERGTLQNLLSVAKWELVPTMSWTLAWEGARRWRRRRFFHGTYPQKHFGARKDCGSL